MMLTHELAHRVKNNLAVVCAFIANEIRKSPAPCVLGYRAMQDRIMAISHLYDLMSQSNLGRTVALETFLAEIAKSLSESLLGEAPGIRITVEAETLEINSERAVPFGLLVNELTTNTIKHAFPHGTGSVTLALRRIESDIELRVADDGIGIRAPNGETGPRKHGSDYVAIFVSQLGGILSRTTLQDVGTTFIIRFPISDGRDRI